MSFEAALASLGDGDRAVVRFFTIDDPNGSQLRSFPHGPQVVPRASLQRAMTRLGLVPCKDLAAGPAPKPEKAASTVYPSFSDSEACQRSPPHSCR